MQEKNARAKKMMLWFAMISMTMTFAGLTSAYVVSSSRADWLSFFELPNQFLYSTLLILTSSITFFLGKKALENHISKMKDIILNYALENANMRDRLEELGELDSLIEDGSVQAFSERSE